MANEGILAAIFVLAEELYCFIIFVNYLCQW